MKKKIPGHTVMWPGIFYVGDEPKSGPALNLGGRLQSRMRLWALPVTDIRKIIFLQRENSVQKMIRSVQELNCMIRSSTLRVSVRRPVLTASSVATQSSTAFLRSSFSYLRATGR